MATKKPRKSKASKRAPEQKPNAARLRNLIDDVIKAQDRGDAKLRDDAVAALGKFSGSHELRRYAVDAQAAANNPVQADSQRILSDIAARLDVSTPGQ